MLTMVTSAWADDCCSSPYAGGWMFDLFYKAAAKRQQAAIDASYDYWQKAIKEGEEKILQRQKDRAK